jgi:hypothetical protein
MDGMTNQTYRPLIKALYPVGGLLLLLAIADPILQSWPLRFGEVRWRFGAVGIFSGAVTGMLLGLALILGVAVILEQRRVVRVFSVLSLLLGAGLTVMVLLFALDALQMRAAVNPTLMTSFMATTVHAAVILVLMIPICLGIGISGWISTRTPAREQRKETVSKQAAVLVHPQVQGGK